MTGTIEISSLLAIAGLISAVGGAWLTIRKITKESEKTRKVEAAAILQAAKEADAKIETAIENKRELQYKELEAKIEAVKKDLHNLRDNVGKDMEHMRETYNGELRNLGEKIEDLRTELRDQHGQLVKLLTTMVGKD